MLNLLAVARNVMDNPGVIVGPIAWILGHIINFFFGIIYSLGIHANSLGISIVLLTIFTRCLMIPLSYKQQKSMFKMQALSPELKKIQEKYKGSTTDPELQRKMQMETQKLYSENKVSPFSGCLPMLIQLPIFLGLYHVMQNPFKYITVINDIYTQMSTIVLTAAQSNSSVLDAVRQVASLARIPDNTGIDVDVFRRILSVLTPSEVSNLAAAVNTDAFNGLINSKDAIEIFLGLSLTEKAALFPVTRMAIIPLLSGVTTYLSSWVMSRKNKDMDPAMRSQQRIMNITMPLMMMWITSSLPGGIGIYWITSNIFQLIQQLILNKHFEKIGAGDIIVPKEKKQKRGGKKF